MAIESKVQLQDSMTTPLLKIIDSLNTVISTFETMDNMNVNIDTTGLENAQKQAQEAGAALMKMRTDLDDAVNKTAHSADNMKSSFSGIGTTIMGLSLVQNAIGMVKGQMDSAINRMDTMTNYSRTMTAITGNAQAATQSLNTMKNATKGTAYGLDTAASSVQGFVTRGLTLGQATNQVSSWMDAVSFYGDGTNETLANVTDALGKMLTKGTVEMDQLDRLTDAGINAVGIYAQATGQSTADVQAALSKGKISAQQFVGTVSDAFENGKNGVLNISGAAKKAGGTWATSIANMKAAVTRGIISITDNINTALTDNGFPTLIEMVQMFGSTAETVMGNVGTVIGNVINFLSPVVTLMKNIGSGIADNWSVIAPIVLGVASALAVFKGVVIAYNAVQMITNALGAIHTAIETTKAAALALSTGATFDATVAQYGLNVALLACPVTWIVIGFIALVAILFAVVAAINKFTGSSLSAIGIVAGAVVALGAIIVNIFKGIWNLGVDVVQFIVNAWNMGTNEIAKFIDTLGIGAGTAFSAIQKGAASAASVLANMFIGGANQAIKAVNWLIKAINKIPGIDIDTISEFGDVSFDFGASNTDKWTNGLENDFASRLANGASTVDLSGYKAQYTDISDAYQTGYNWGKNAQNTIGSKISNALNPKTGATDTSKLANTADASNLANTAGNTAKTAKNTNDTSKALKATSEDLKYIKDLAERDTINKFTTASINVSMNNNNTITKEMDIDVFTKHFTTKIEEQMAKASKGVY